MLVNTHHAQICMTNSLQNWWKVLTKSLGGVSDIMANVVKQAVDTIHSMNMSNQNVKLLIQQLC